tara:strand:- start:449 stop:694 length:246 start_codon:yes stop_codon:yes gene_type:complete
MKTTEKETTEIEVVYSTTPLGYVNCHLSLGMGSFTGTGLTKGDALRKAMAVVIACGTISSMGDCIATISESVASHARVEKV